MFQFTKPAKLKWKSLGVFSLTIDTRLAEEISHHTPFSQDVSMRKKEGKKKPKQHTHTLIPTLIIYMEKCTLLQKHVMHISPPASYRDTTRVYSRGSTCQVSPSRSSSPAMTLNPENSPFHSVNWPHYRHNLQLFLLEYKETEQGAASPQSVTISSLGWAFLLTKAWFSSSSRWESFQLYHSLYTSTLKINGVWFTVNTILFLKDVFLVYKTMYF